MGFEPVTSQFNIGYTVKLPRATTFCRRPPSQNNKILSVNAFYWNLL